MIGKSFSKIFGKNNRNVFIIIACLFIPLLLSVKEGFVTKDEFKILMGEEYYDKTMKTFQRFKDAFKNAKEPEKKEEIINKMKTFQKKTMNTVNTLGTKYANVQQRIENEDNEEEIEENITQRFGEKI